MAEVFFKTLAIFPFRYYIIKQIINERNRITEKGRLLFHGRELLQKSGARRLLIMIMGNVFCGMENCIFNVVRPANDPFQRYGQLVFPANILASLYASFLLVINGGLFIFELAAGRRLNRNRHPW